jgi:quinoprotein glucose dehydrogenase
MRSALLALLAVSCASTTPPPTTDIEWSAFAGDQGGTHYSAAADITRENVGRLQPAWTYHTGALVPATELNRKAAFEATPLMVDGTLYVITPFNKVIALDPATGAERWTYDPRVDRSYSYSEVTSRGVSVWRRGGETRLFFGTLDGRLIAIDGRTGKPHWQVDLKHDAGTFYAPDYAVTSPPAVIGDLVVVGSSIGDNSNVDTGSGVVRAYDVRSGKLRWAFDPLLPMSDGSRSGAANAWAPIAADVARGLVFIPTSSPSPDYFGGLRPGDDRYANSVVAIEAKSGKVVWHFQVVHHDLWDYDVASQPTLVDFKGTPAVAVTTKMGHVFLLDRRTGRPLLPVEERAVPKSDIAGEAASATQPFPMNPALGQAPVEAWGVTAEDKEECGKRLASLRYEGVFTPPSVGGTLVYPSNVGGINWSGSSYDPARGLLIAPVNRLPVAARLIPRDQYDEQLSKAGDNRMKGEFARQRGTPFGMYREVLVSAHELPCIAPPWGLLVALDVRDGSKRWEVPLGKVALPGGAVIEGLPSFGGALVTGGGLVFIAGTLRDDTLRAHDVETGRVLWSAPLPAGGQAAPMTYRHRGKQYVVISAGGHAKAGTTLGDSVIAYALP